MYTVAIVDDEPAIREGLALHIDWQSMGFDLVKLFEDGEDVLDYLAHHHLDVVLTDIRMSVVSGLSLAQTVCDSHIPTEVVLLSGYKDFEFAQQAMKAGVFHYLLKPTDPRELADVFEQVAARIRERESLPTRRHIQRLLCAGRAQVLVRLVNGLIESEQELREAFATALLPLEQSDARIDYALIRAEAGSATDFHGRLELFCRDERSWKTTAVSEPPGLIHFLCVLTPREGEPGAKTICGGGAASVFRQLCEETFVPAKRVGFRVVLDLEDLRSVDLLTLSERIHAAERPERDGRIHARGPADISSLLIDSAPVDETDVRRLFSTFVSAVPLPERIGQARRFCISVASELVSEARRRRPDSRIGESVDFEALIGCDSISELSTWITSTAVCLTRDLTRTPDVPDVVERACSYILGHVECDLSLTRVAAELFLSDSYLSRIFKQETGSTFVQFVTETRLEVARKLLAAERGASIAEIAERVGYSDPKYFSRLFRARIGATPSEYRSMLRAQCG